MEIAHDMHIDGESMNGNGNGAEHFRPNSSGGFPVGVERQDIVMYASDWVEERRVEALKLYFRVLGQICAAEEVRLLKSAQQGGAQGVGIGAVGGKGPMLTGAGTDRRSGRIVTLIANERFQRCLLVCCSELILFTFKSRFRFPDSLATVGVSAFDVSKLIETVVRHEDSLPSDLKKHLNSCDEQILESIAWDKGSSLYACLMTTNPQLVPEIQRLNLLPPPMMPIDNLSRGRGRPLPQGHPSLDRTQTSGDVSHHVLGPWPCLLFAACSTATGRPRLQKSLHLTRPAQPSCPTPTLSPRGATGTPPCLRSSPPAPTTECPHSQPSSLRARRSTRICTPPLPGQQVTLVVAVMPPGIMGSRSGQTGGADGD